MEVGGEVRSCAALGESVGLRYEANESSRPFCLHRFPTDWESEDVHFCYLGCRREIPCVGVLETEVP